MGQKDLGPKVRCLSFKYDRKPLVQHLTLFVHFSHLTDLSLPENSKLFCLRVFAHASPTPTWNILSSICISGSSYRFQFQHNLLREALPVCSLIHSTNIYVLTLASHLEALRMQQ